MGVDWDKQTRDPCTGRWVDDDSKVLAIRIRLSAEERDLIEAAARRTGRSMSQVVMDAVHAQVRTPSET